MKCTCRGEIMHRPEEHIFYCQNCGNVLDEEGQLLRGVVIR